MNNFMDLMTAWVLQSNKYLDDYGEKWNAFLTKYPVVKEMDEEFTWVILGQENEK